VSAWTHPASSSSQEGQTTVADGIGDGWEGRRGGEQGEGGIGAAVRDRSTDGKFEPDPHFLISRYFSTSALSINLPSMGDARDVDDPLIIID
jgi:hypothetical protein